MYKTYIENVGEEIKIEVDFDYQPYEPMTRHYPGCSEDVDITEVRYDNSEICLLPKVEELLVEEILNYIYDKKRETNHGYYV